MFIKRTGIQLAVPFSERRLNNLGCYHTAWAPPYLIQPKLNGERCRALVQGDRCLLLSSTEHIIATLPHINAALLSLPDGEYDGELYVHGWTFSRIASAVATQDGSNSDTAHIQYHIFDIIQDVPQLERAVNLNELELDPHEALQKVPFSVASTLPKIMYLYIAYIDQGYEGFIIREASAYYTRKRTGQMMKYKPKKTDKYPIYTVNEAISGTGRPLGMVGSFVCYDEMNTHFKVGAGKLSHSQRRCIWEMFQDGALKDGASLLIEYQCLSDKARIPHFSRAIKLFTKEIK